MDDIHQLNIQFVISKSKAVSFVHLTYKDVARFWNGSVHKLYIVQFNFCVQYASFLFVFNAFNKLTCKARFDIAVQSAGTDLRGSHLQITFTDDKSCF